MEKNTFSNETLNAAVAAMGELHDEINQLRTQMQTEPVNETAQRYLMDKLGMTQSEAEEICDNIQKGISEFESLFNNNSVNGKISLRSKLEEVTADMEEDKCANYLSAILTALQVGQKEAMTPEQINDLQANNSKRPSAELINEIEKLADKEFPLDKLSEFVNSSINANSIIHLSHEIELSKGEYRYLAAIMLYVGQREGKIKLSDSEEPMPTSMLGSLASAAIEAIITTGNLKEGKIDLKHWQVVLKWILGALLGCALICLAILAIGFIASSVIGVIISFLGTSFIAVMAAVAIALYTSWDLSKYTVDGIFYLLDILSSIYDQYIEPITQKMAAMSKAIKDCFSNLSKKTEGKQETVTNSEEIRTESSEMTQSASVTLA